MERTMKMTSQLSLRAGLALALSVLVGLPLGASTAGATPTTFDLCATAGSTTLPGTAGSVPVWGYTDCTVGATITKPGGPILEYAQGDAVSITLHNNLTVQTGLVFPGVPKPPDTTGVAPGATKTYTFTVAKPGTFLYEAALLPNAQYQVAMGLYGAMNVLPAAAGKAYGDAQATQDSNFTSQATLVLSEIDPALNQMANPAAFNMRNFAPHYGLINGAVHPNTATIPAAAGDKVLLRYVNAGLKLHSMAALGVRQSVIAYDGNELRYPHTVVAETFGPGQTADVIATVPATASAGNKYAIYDGSLSLHNSASGTGGMLTFIAVAGSTTPATTPTTTGVTLSPNPTNGSVAVTVNAAITANDGAEYFIDSVGTSGTGRALSTTISVADLAALGTGIHVVYVHGHNASGWGPVASAPLNLDKAGPLTTGLTLTPPITNGTGAVTLGASGSDATTGGANVTGGTYAVAGGGSGTLTPSGPVGVATALTASIPVDSLTEGTHAVTVSTTDSQGNTGAAATISLIVDKSGPIGTPGSISATPNPSNGTIGVSSGVPAVRVRSTFTDSWSNIAGAEGFIDHTPVATDNGKGFVFSPSDGVWGPRVAGTSSDAVFADIPLATVAALSDGSHTISVHAKDAAGNWGAALDVTLLVDKIAPTFTSASLTPSSVTAGTASVVLNANGTDSGSGVAGGEYWFGTATLPAGTGIAFTGVTPSIPVSALAPGSYTIRARIRDAAGNWSSAVRNATLVVTFADAIFSNGFENGQSPWGWSTTSTNTAARLNRTAAAALAGGFGLQAQGNNTNYVQWDFPTGTAVSTYDAKFSFRPNGNASTGNDIFTARTTGGGTVFRVRYRMNAGTPQVQIQVGANNTNTTWTNINGGTAVNTVQVVWQANSTLVLYVNGTVASQSLTATNNSIGSVRFGSVTSGGSATSMYFDSFASKRLVTPLLP
jgi:hypothetical protein